MDGVSAYTGNAPELYAKTSKNPEESGWGLELSFRLKRTADEQKAPLRPVPMLQNLARYVFKNHRSRTGTTLLGAGPSRATKAPSSKP